MRIGRLPWLRARALALACVLCAAPAAAGPVSRGDLLAATRALGFLDTLSQRPAISVMVIAASKGDEQRAEAQDVAERLSSLRVSEDVAVLADSATWDELLQGGQTPDVLYLMPGASVSPRIADYVRRNRVVSLSNDPSCLASGACVLMVRSGSGVNIVLDTKLANAAGARFASIFIMMVKRK